MRGGFSATSPNPSRSSIRPSLLRIVGVDDGAFPGRQRGNRTSILVAALLEGERIVGVRGGRIQVDGLDAQRVLLSLLSALTYDAVMLSGISFGGFNLINIKEVSLRIKKPVIAVIGEKPNNRAVLEALRKHFPDWGRRWRIVSDAGKLYWCKPLAEEPRLYFEVKGASPVFARRIIASASMISRLPEPVRVAGLLAKGLSSRVKFP